MKLGELHFSDKIFYPMEILDREMNHLLDYSEPGLHFYNEIYQKSIHKCNYLTESSLEVQISLFRSRVSAPLSLCHINIRSLNRNLDNFIMFIESLEFEFSVCVSPKPGYEMITVIYMVYRDIQYVKSVEIMLWWWSYHI